MFLSTKIVRYIAYILSFNFERILQIRHWTLFGIKEIDA